MPLNSALHPAPNADRIYEDLASGGLLNFHAAGVIPIVGLVALSCSLCAADRRGLLVMRHPVA